MGRLKRAMEPAMYAGVTKTCPFCSSTNAEYKFLNNKCMQQPRYKCLGCNKLFTHNPASRRKTHPGGYAKNAVACAELLPNIADVPCPNPSCGNIGTSKFMYFDNANFEQPRYKCGTCNTSFTNGGRRSPKRNRSAQAVDIPGNPTHLMLDQMGANLLSNANSPSVMELVESHAALKAVAENFLDEIKWDELPDIDTTSFPEMMQSREVVERANEQALNEIHLAKLPDFELSEYFLLRPMSTSMEMMQLFNFHEEGRECISEQTNPVEHLLNISSSSFMEEWESVDAQDEANDQTQEAIKRAEVPDFDYSSFMGAVQLSDVPEEAIEHTLHKTKPIEMRDIDSSSFMEMMEIPNVLEELNINDSDELNIDSPDFMARLQLPADPMEWGIQ